MVIVEYLLNCPSNSAEDLTSKPVVRSAAIPCIRYSSPLLPVMPAAFSLLSIFVPFTEAYSSAAAEACKDAGLMRVLMGRQVDVSLDYTDYGKIEYLIRDKGIPVMSSDFAEDVKVSVMTLDEADPESSLMTSEMFVNKVTELTNGRAKTEVSDPVEFGLQGDRKVIQD